MANQDLTKEEKKFLDNFKMTTLQGELAQTEELKLFCSSPHQYAKTHSVYIKDWAALKEKMITHVRHEIVPDDLSVDVYREMIKIIDKIMEEKLEKVRKDFFIKFGESIYNYLGDDGKTKSCLGVIVFFIGIGASLFFNLNS